MDSDSAPGNRNLEGLFDWPEKYQRSRRGVNWSTQGLNMRGVYHERSGGQEKNIEIRGQNKGSSLERI